MRRGVEARREVQGQSWFSCVGPDWTEAGAEEDPKQLGSKPKNIYFEIGFLSYFGQLLQYIVSHAFENGRAGTEISSLKQWWQRREAGSGGKD